MDYKDFEKLALANGAEQSYREPDNQIRETVFTVQWESGGKKGGNCWDGVAEYITPEEEPEFDRLFEFLNLLIPNLLDTSKYNILNHTQVITNEYDDYYGNYTEVSYKSVYVRDIYDCLKVELELLGLSEITLTDKANKIKIF